MQQLVRSSCNTGQVFRRCVHTLYQHQALGSRYKTSDSTHRNHIKSWNIENKLLFGTLKKSNTKKTKKESDTSSKVAKKSKFKVSDAIQVEPDTSFVNGQFLTPSDSSVVSNLILNPADEFTKKGQLLRNLLTFPILGTDSVTEESSWEDDSLIEYAKGAEIRTPSVGKILNDTRSPESQAQLNKWEEGKKQELGKEGFQVFKKGLFTRGNDLHRCIQSYIEHEEDLSSKLTNENRGYWNSVLGLLPNIRDVRSQEKHVVHEKLCYLGVLDTLAVYRDQLCLIEWKTSSRPRPSLADSYDNPLQVAAYIGALNSDSRFDFKVERGVLVIAYEDGSPATVHLMSGKVRQTYWTRWLQRLHLFWSMKLPSDVIT